MKYWVVAGLLYTAFCQASFLDSPSTVVYWGQNSKGGSDTQKPLSAYCDDGADAIIISFVLNFKNGNLPDLNLANACTEPFFPGTSLLSCPAVGKDIKECQKKGKTILVSLGGAAGSYGFANDQDASAFADTLWNVFGNGKSNTRPFGDAVVDGFDFDIEGGGPGGYTALANRLRSHYKEDSSKKYYITGAPQCPYPDALLGPALESADFDAVFVQFYNNYCSTTSSNFNFETWDKWVKNTSKNKDAKVFLGIPGSPGAAGSGYVPYSSLAPIVQNLYKTYPSFGGVSIWDASQSTANTEVSPNFQKAVSSLVSGLKGGVSTTTVSSTSTKTTATSTKTTDKPTETSKTTTTTKTATTTTTSTSVPTSTPGVDNCVKEGSPCTGTFACSGNSYATCVHDKWLLRPCPSGLVCLSTTDGASIYCAQGEANTCSKKASKGTIGAGSSTAKPYKNKAVNAQLSLGGSSDGTFNATINARTMKQHVFKENVKVQFKVNQGTKITHVNKGSVRQKGNVVTINYRNPTDTSVSVVIGLQGELPTKNTIIGPSMSNMKFY
ncbi:glycoside hydrolase superfamily [Sporodiniella umbellata]|nr:glycoside hydrolase superfamily [Sporodiniella umbellata]KAI9262666.1 glycoside hydrolase superfamily [Sporodiniella umbellata]